MVGRDGGWEEGRKGRRREEVLPTYLPREGKREEIPTYLPTYLPREGGRREEVPTYLHTYIQARRRARPANDAGVHLRPRLGPKGVGGAGQDRANQI